MMFKGHKRRWVGALIVVAAIAALAIWHFSHPAPTQFKTVKVAKRDCSKTFWRPDSLTRCARLTLALRSAGSWKACMSRSAIR